MGAICGIIVPEDHGKATKLGPRIFEKLQIYNYDRIGNAVGEGVYLGSGLIFNTPESRLEQLPRESANHRYLLTADAVIDNRDELFDAFGLDKKRMSGITDSELILRAYEKWGYDCPKYLTGDYAFALWDKDRRELYLARDPMGPRTLYFTSAPGMFAFCTIEKPLLGITGTTPELNEKWLADFLAIDGIQHELDCRETVYSGIFQLLPANYAIVNADGLKQVQFWDLLKDAAPVRFKTDEEYVEAFNQIFFEAVSCRLRSAGETAIMLSGGLDSGSIACVAARQLEENGRKLHAFSSIPVEDFDEVPDKRTIYNETNEVELIARSHSNIHVSYCSFEGSNSLADMDELIGIFEQPYKIFQNMTWYRPMLERAAANNCTIMLNGQFGNGTISYGDFLVHLLTLYRTGKFVTAVKEIHALSELLGVPVKKVYRLAAHVIMPYGLRRWLDRRRNKEHDRFKNVVVNRSLIGKWNVEKRLDEVGGNVLSAKHRDYDQERERRASQMALCHIAAMETKLSLANRITIRDPSRDRRVVEFCLSIPSDQFVKNGHERNLIRRAMKGILPDPIRTNTKTRGLQSADWMHRLKHLWQMAAEEMDKLLSNEEIRPYIDGEKLHELRAQMENCLKNKDADIARQTLIVIIFARFLMDFKRLSTNEVFV